LGSVLLSRGHGSGHKDAQSDIAHEVAHVLLNHELASVEKIGKLNFFTCDPDEEQEANWLARDQDLVLAAA
jgi:hypothetical protein